MSGSPVAPITPITSVPVIMIDISGLNDNVMVNLVASATNSLKKSNDKNPKKSGVRKRTLIFTSKSLQLTREKEEAEAKSQDL
ncbi:7251_t:CDS:2, partial [Dentiscutata erythropus]